MKLKSYTIHFKGGPITVRAFNCKEAEILAKAEAIKKGWDYTIVNNIDIYNLPKEFSFKSNINRLVDMYYAVETEHDYIVTADNGCSWRLNKSEMRHYLHRGDFVIVGEET